MRKAITADAYRTGAHDERVDKLTLVGPDGERREVFDVDLQLSVNGKVLLDLGLDTVEVEKDKLLEIQG